jgi:hypothetical protein
VELLLNRGQRLGRGGREERPPLLAVQEIKRHLAGIIVFLNVGPHLKGRKGGGGQRGVVLNESQSHDIAFFNLTFSSFIAQPTEVRGV